MSNEAVKLEGGKELRNLFNELPKRVRSKGLRQAVSAGATPVVKALKADTPRVSGLLKKAETKKIKTYKGGTNVIAVIGANVNTAGEYNGRNRVPANYFHLVEDGVAPHSLSKGASIRRKRAGDGNGAQHPGFAGRHMLKNAYNTTKDQAGSIMVDKLQSVLESEAEKLANGG